MVGDTSINNNKFNIYTFKLTEKKAGYGLMDPLALDIVRNHGREPNKRLCFLESCSGRGNLTRSPRRPGVSCDEFFASQVRLYCI
jgi:hypothetical protein